MRNGKLDWPLIGISLVAVLGVAVFLHTQPTAAASAANWIFATFTDLFGAAVLLATLATVITLQIVACGKYGCIRLGDAAPEYSTFKWIAMMCSCGLGSATCYWAFIEWAYYIKTPGLGLEPFSRAAYEMSVAYSMFHWGFSAWSLYAFLGVALAYHFHVRRNADLSLSGIICAVRKQKSHSILCRAIDALFVCMCLGGLSITLGVSIPLVTEVLCSVIGIAPSLGLSVAIILAISLVYSLSSLVGIQKGMARISNFNIHLAILFSLLLLLFGPTKFIIDNTTQSFGLMLQNYIRMSLFTDPIGKSGFPASWTIFYWLYWLTYVPFTGIFIAKISKGRTIRSVILNTILSGSFGCFLYFGILGGTALHRKLNHLVDVTRLLESGQANVAIVAVMRSLPFGNVLIILFCLSSLMFLATTLDGAAFALAATTTKGLRNDQESPPFLRLFWCVMLSLIPLTLILIKADLDTIKTCAIVTAFPILILMLWILIGMTKWLRQDYGHLSKSTMEKMLLENDKFERQTEANAISTVSDNK